MNPVFAPNAQPLFVNHTQTPPNVYPSGNGGFTSNVTMVRPAFGDTLFSQIALGVINFTKQLEQAKIKVYPKPTAAYPYPAMNPLFIWALQQAPLCAHFTDLFEGFEPHPHLKAFHQFALENIGVVTSPQPVPNYIFENNFDFFRGQLYVAKAQLQANKYEAQVQKLRNEQKTVFRRVMQTQDQANCIFLELPLITQTDPPHYQTQEEAEKDSVKLLKKYFQWLHGAKQLSGILSDIQWRIVKGLDHKLTAQAFIYILGDEIDYLPLLKEQWEFTCLDFHLQGIFPVPRHTHCYNGQGIIQKTWLQLIERVHEPLGFYRYKGNGITYVWKEYAGNV
ncbi:hypothetical protein EXE25_05030 [Acinetobacter bouvetii]|uniref:Uncharacterized protein n=1 Tax=Acinetobacter bouvetii TaxID=202951 RepID=A0A4Q7B1G8_9GAMM|nr:hypothetical protein [Acinetobacter bouvetii]RZG68421.1 hypothetical protein EXE25_05030 [Acinetobacter bouvetii]